MRLICGFLLVVAGLAAQSANVVNSSRSNIKNNLEVTSSGRLNCLTEAKKPCTSVQVKEIAGALELQKLGIKTLEAAPDGSVKCETAPGKACTKEQSAAVAKALEAAKRGANDPIGGGSVGSGKKSGPDK